MVKSLIEINEKFLLWLYWLLSSIYENIKRLIKDETDMENKLQYL